LSTENVDNYTAHPSSTLVPPFSILCQGLAEQLTTLVHCIG
jgi:hypothetical protein